MDACTHSDDAEVSASIWGNDGGSLEYVIGVKPIPTPIAAGPTPIAAGPTCFS